MDDSIELRVVGHENLLEVLELDAQRALHLGDAEKLCTHRVVVAAARKRRARLAERRRRGAVLPEDSADPPAKRDRMSVLVDGLVVHTILDEMERVEERVASPLSEAMNGVHEAHVLRPERRVGLQTDERMDRHEEKLRSIGRDRDVFDELGE